jgi:hypothetical protein
LARHVTDIPRFCAYQTQIIANRPSLAGGSTDTGAPADRGLLPPIGRGFEARSQKSKLPLVVEGSVVHASAANERAD